jgi:hypothetical protein
MHIGVMPFYWKNLTEAHHLDQRLINVGLRLILGNRLWRSALKWTQSRSDVWILLLKCRTFLFL